MRTRGQAWLVGGSVGEGSSLTDQILQEEYELPRIVTSRADEKRGSEQDVVRKRHRSHAGAKNNMGQGKDKVMNGMSNQFPILPFFPFIDSTASWS